MIIRKATKSDMKQVLELVEELADYEREPEAVITSLEDYESGFESELFYCIVADKGSGQLVGIALYYYCFSTWRGKAMYLEDFYIKKASRNKGIGRMIFDAFLKDCVEKECRMVRWQVLSWNKPAINFYKKLHATMDKEWWNGYIYF